MDGTIKQTALEFHNKGIGIYYHDLHSLFTPDEAFQFINAVKKLNLDIAISYIDLWDQNSNHEYAEAPDFYPVDLELPTPDYAQVSYGRAIEVIQEIDERYGIDRLFLLFENEKEHKIRLALHSIMSDKDYIFKHPNWASRPLENTDTLFLQMLKHEVNIAGKNYSIFLYFALCQNEDSEKSIPGFAIYEDNNSPEIWKSFLENLSHRGLKKINLVKSKEKYAGLEDALQKHFPKALWHYQPDEKYNIQESLMHSDFRGICHWQERVKTFPTLDTYTKFVSAVLEYKETFYQTKN